MHFWKMSHFYYVSWRGNSSLPTALVYWAEITIKSVYDNNNVIHWSWRKYELDILNKFYCTSNICRGSNWNRLMIMSVIMGNMKQTCFTKSFLSLSIMLSIHSHEIYDTWVLFTLLLKYLCAWSSLRDLQKAYGYVFYL